MTPLDKDFYENMVSLVCDNHLKDRNKDPTTPYTLSAEPKEMTFPKYKGARGSGKSMTELEDLLSTNATLFKDYVKDREASLKEDYILEIVNCFTKAFEQVYSNECPVELVNLCKENVGNFVKYLDGFTKM